MAALAKNVQCGSFDSLLHHYGFGDRREYVLFPHHDYCCDVDHRQKRAAVRAVQNRPLLPKIGFAADAFRHRLHSQADRVGDPVRVDKLRQQTLGYSDKPSKPK